ncbi:DNA-binding transcriptional regulator DsdC, partial [Salmonella enterica subsp. enterica serovar Infantis]
PLLPGPATVNLQRARSDLASYFDEAPAAQLTPHFLMDEAILPVCSPEYAHRFALQAHLNILRRCTRLHARQAWGTDSG